MLNFTLIFHSINRKNWNYACFVFYTFKREQKLATLHTDLLTDRNMIQEPPYRLNSNSPSLSLPSVTTKLLLLLRWKYMWYQCSGKVKKYIHAGDYDIYSCLIGVSNLANCKGTYTLTNLPFYLYSYKILRGKIKKLTGKKPMYEQGSILLPHLATLGWGINNKWYCVNKYEDSWPIHKSWNRKSTISYRSFFLNYTVQSGAHISI